MSSSPGGSNESLETRLGVLTERVTGSERAMVLQAKEYERRLEELNHAHARQVAMQMTFVSKDSWDGMMEWRDGVNKSLTLLDGKAAAASSARVLLFQIIAAIMSLLALAAILWRR